MDKKIIGIDLGGTTAKFAILTPEGEIQQKWSIDTNILEVKSTILCKSSTSSKAQCFAL